MEKLQTRVLKILPCSHRVDKRCLFNSFWRQELHRGLEIRDQVCNLGAVMETKQDAGVVFPLLAAFASPLLLSQRVFQIFAGFEDTLRKLVGARALVSIWSAAISLLTSSGRRDDLSDISIRDWSVKFSQYAATSAIILLTRNGACSGELDGGGRAKMAKFIIQSD